MGDKKFIAFYVCTNGLGHYKRVYEIVNHLSDSFDITIYCSKKQAEKIGLHNKCRYVFYKVDNIRWDKVVEGQYKEVEKTYFDWLMEYGPTVKKYDLIVSDNLSGLLNFRNDIILSGSFLWGDVFKDYLGTNGISSHEEVLIKAYNPIILTNKYVETQSIKEYNNKIQFGFGCQYRENSKGTILRTILLEPSLSYRGTYRGFLDSISSLNKFDITNNLSYINNVRIVARPGVGTITHCVEYNIPLVALYSDDDSKEIIELADRVEELGIGIKQNINEPLDEEKFKLTESNINFFTKSKFDKNGYRDIAQYLKSL